MLGIVLALPLVFAMIAGTNYTVEFGGMVSECYILNNEFDLEGLNFTMFENKVIISTEPNYKPDNFTISCLVEGTMEEQEQHYSGGSSGGSYYNKPKEKVNETDLINDLRKEVLLKELLERQQSEQIEPKVDEVISEIPDENNLIVTDEKKSYMGWIIVIVVIVAILIITLIIILKTKSDGFA